MGSPLVSVLILTLLTQMSDRACGLDLNASENPVPVGDSVTLSLSSPLDINLGSWLHDATTIVYIYPTGSLSMDASRITFNRTSSSLSITSLTLSDAGIYKLQCAACPTPIIASLTLYVQAPISNVTVRASATNLVELNDTVILTCSVSSGSSLSYLWLNGSSEVTAREGVQLGDGDSTLTIVGVTRYDQEPFRCNVSNNISSDASQFVHLNISYGPSDPKIMAMPMKVAYPTGSNITLSCEAESKPQPTVQWLFDEINLDQFSSQLHLVNAQKNQTGNYKCLLHNTVTSLFNDVSRMITIMEPISNVELKRVGGPVILNESFTLSCEVNVPVDYFHWLRDGEAILSTNMSTVNNTMTINQAQLSDDGDYTCEAFNAVSNKTSNPYGLLVNYGPENTSIKGPSTSLTGRSVIFNCTSSSQPPSHFEWYFNGSLVGSTSEHNTGPLTLAMDGKYSCVAHNNITGKNDTNYKTLTVYAPVTMTSVKIVGSQPVLNRAFSLACETVGSVHSVYWMKDGWPMHADGTRNVSMDNATLSFDPVLPSDNGLYQCDASNPLSSDRSDNFTLKVEFGPDKPVISGPSLAETGQEVVLHCSAQSEPPSQFTWYFNGSLLANSSVLTIHYMTLNLSGKYDCMAHNNVTGGNSSTTTMIKVIEGITSVMVKADTIPIDSHNLTLTCEVTGPYDSIYWMRNSLYGNSTRLDNNCSSVDSNVSFCIMNNSLHFNPVTVSEDGNYVCVATNTLRPHMSPEYLLLVNYGPLHVTITGPGSVDQGSVAFVSLNCYAESRPDCEYQWFFNNQQSALHDTSTINIIATKPNEGNYTCKAKNPVTNITMSQRKQLLINRASARPLLSTGGVMLVALLTLSMPVISERLTH